jgi:hypothetical protein
LDQARVQALERFDPACWPDHYQGHLADCSRFGKTTSTGAASANAFRYTRREEDGTGLY